MQKYREFVHAQKDDSAGRKLLETLSEKCMAPPGCQEDLMSYYAKLVDAAQMKSAPTRERAVTLHEIFKILILYRQNNAYYLFGMAEAKENLGSMDRNVTLLRDAASTYEAALRADSTVSVLDETTRYKAWAQIALLYRVVGDEKEASRWLRIAQASGYPWHDVWQLPYPRMYHSHFVAKPFWEGNEAAHLRFLTQYFERHHAVLRQEVQAAMNLPNRGAERLISFTGATNLISAGNWTQIKMAGDDPVTKAIVWNEELCGPGGAFTRTCAVLRGSENIHAAAITGAAKFYLIAPGSRLKPHYGQGNIRLFLQLGIIVPPGVSISAGGVERAWAEGKALILDDSFMHSVEHTGTAPRVTLSVPIWHPNIYHRFNAKY